MPLFNVMYTISTPPLTHVNTLYDYKDSKHQYPYDCPVYCLVTKTFVTSELPEDLKYIFSGSKINIEKKSEIQLLLLIRMLVAILNRHYDNYYVMHNPC